MGTNRDAHLKILINAFSARLGGGQTYLINLLEFLRQDESVEVFVLAPDSLEMPERRNIRSNPCSLAGGKPGDPCDLGKRLLGTARETFGSGRLVLSGWNHRFASSARLQDCDDV